MAERFVYVFEIIEIDEQHGFLAVAARVAGYGLLEPVKQQNGDWDARDAVVECEIPDLVLGGLGVGNVPRHVTCMERLQSQSQMPRATPKIPCHSYSSAGFVHCSRLSFGAIFPRHSHGLWIHPEAKFRGRMADDLIAFGLHNLDKRLVDLNEFPVARSLILRASRLVWNTVR